MTDDDRRKGKADMTIARTVVVGLLAYSVTALALLGHADKLFA